MTFEEYQSYDALALAELVRKGSVAPQQLLDIAIRRAEAVNPSLNIIVTKLYDVAMGMLQTFPKDAPFAGVPFLIKDLSIHVSETPMQSGCKGYEGFITPKDGELTERLRASGFVFMGKSATPEFGLTPFTEPRAFGVSRNPWNNRYTTGGSSGGSAAAVAAGIVPIATASDGGGSIRIPAACCGIFGLKPTRGRIPLGDHTAEQWSGATVEGCVSRSVRDTAAYLDALQGGYIGASYIIKPPTRPYLQELNEPTGKLRIAFCLENPFSKQTDPDNTQALQHTITILRDLGHTVEETSLPYNAHELVDFFTPLICGETALQLEILGEHLGRKVTEKDVELNTWLSGKLGTIYTAKDYARCRYKWGEWSLMMGNFHRRYDLLLTPTLGKKPIKLGELQNSAAEKTALRIIKRLGLSHLVIKTNIVQKVASRLLGYIPYTPLANVTGQPSMSVPLWQTKDNVPIGSMFTGRLGEEDLLLRLAAQLEKAQPWFNKIPKIG